MLKISIRKLVISLLFASALFVATAADVTIETAANIASQCYAVGDTVTVSDDSADPPDFWKAHDRAGIPCEPDAPVTVSMTLENRGFAPIAGRYRFRVEPAGAARIEGPKTLAFDLAPDGRAGWEATLVPTGSAARFRLVATCSAPDQPGADLRFESPLRGGHRFLDRMTGVAG